MIRSKSEVCELVAGYRYRPWWRDFGPRATYKVFPKERKAEIPHTLYSQIILKYGEHAFEHASEGKVVEIPEIGWWAITKRRPHPSAGKNRNVRQIGVQEIKNPKKRGVLLATNWELVTRIFFRADWKYHYPKIYKPRLTRSNRVTLWTRLAESYNILKYLTYGSHSTRKS